MGGTVKPPVLTLSNCCPNGVQLSPSGTSTQFTVISNVVANLVVSLNGNNVGNYSGVTSQIFSLLPNPNYNEVIITGSNSSGSSEVVCSFYGYTGVGSNGSYYYYDQNNNNNTQITWDDIDPIWQIIEAGLPDALPSAANALALYLHGLVNAPEGATPISSEGAIPVFCSSIISAIIAQQQMIPDSPLNLSIPQNTLIQFNNAYANNQSGQGTIAINNNQTTISWDLSD